MKISKDSITTLSGNVTAISAVLAGLNIYPQYTGLLAAISHSITAYYTNRVN